MDREIEIAMRGGCFESRFGLEKVRERIGAALYP